MGLKKVLFSGITLLLILTLSGCGGGLMELKKLFYKTSTVVLSIKTSDDLNPNRKGRPSPVVIYLYELSDGAPFDEADFFMIYDSEAETIGSVLLGKLELELKPGETRKIERTLKGETRHLGILAAFRDVDNAKWRASMVMPEHSKIKLKLRMDALSITLTED